MRGANQHNHDIEEQTVQRQQQQGAARPSPYTANTVAIDMLYERCRARKTTAVVMVRCVADATNRYRNKGKHKDRILYDNCFRR